MWWRNKWIIGLLAAVATAFILPDLYRVYDDYLTLGFEVDNDGYIFNVNEQVKAEIEGCESIDIARTDFENRLAIFAGLGGRQYVRPSLESVRFVCKHDDAQLRDERTIVPRKPERSRSPLLARSLLLTQQLIGLLFIFFATAALWQRPNLATLGFFLYAIWFNPGQNYVLYAEAQRLPYLVLTLEMVQAVLQALGYWGFVVFALHFPKGSSEQWHRRTQRAIGFVAIVLALLQISSFATAFGFRTELVTRASLYVGYGVALAVVPIVWLRYRSLTFQDRERMLWVFVGCAIGLPSYILADLASSTSALSTSWNASEEWLAVLYLANALLLYSVVIAIRRHRLVRVTFALGRKAVLVLAWAVTFLIIAVLATQLEHYLEHVLFGVENRPIDRPEIVLTIFRFGFYYLCVALLKFMVDRSVEQVTHRVDRIFFRQHHQAQQRLRRAITDLEDNVSRLPAVYQQLVDCPVRVLSLTWGVLFVRQDDGTFRQAHLCNATSTIASPPGPSRDLIRLWEANSARISIPVSDHPELIDRDVQSIDFPSLATPIVVGGRLVAIVFYGAHLGGDDIDDVEMRRLDELAHAAGMAWLKTEIGSLREKIRELETHLKGASEENDALAGQLRSCTEQIEELRAHLK
jgi:hypothetical protein